MNIKRAFKNDKTMKALTGVTIGEFNSLLPTFTEFLWEKACKKKRKRKPGGGRNGKMKQPENKLFFMLFYFKTYPKFALAAFIYDIDESRPCRWKEEFMPILEKTLGRKLVLPERRIDSMEEFIQKFPEIKDIFADGTERRTQRHKSYQKQKKHYSGKKKCHTRKNIIWNDENKKILVVSPTKPGKMHDKKMTDKEGLLHHIPPWVTAWFDSGFQGAKDIHPNSMIPKKETKKRKLTPEEKAENRTIAGIRIVSEHAMAGIKRFGCLVDVYRNKKGQDDKFITLCAGLWNFHLQNY
jgi:hypothetical protein